MKPRWLRYLMGERMPPTQAVLDLDDERRQAQEANDKGDRSLAEIKQIRSESLQVHQRVKKTLTDNHFADLMTRALESRP